MSKLSGYNRYIFLLTILLFSCLANANENKDGEQFLTNIKYQNSINNYVWCIAQSSRNTLLVASRTGVMEYNSVNWNAIKTPDIALYLLPSKLDDRIYTCGRNHIGYLELNKYGQYTYLSIKNDIPSGIYTKIVEADSGVYFYSSENLLYYNRSESSLISLLDTNIVSSFLGSFVNNNSLYLNVANEGVKLVSNNTLVKGNGLEELENQPLAFSCRYDSLTTLIGTKNGKLYLYGTGGLKSFNIEDEEYLQKGIISDGILYAESQIVISFKNLGIIIIDKYTGRTINTVDSESGLPDDMATTIFADSDKALWVAHRRGLSRIDVSLPIKNYSSYYGVEGSILTSNYWNNKFYVATSEGVFLLDSISDYDRREAYKKIPIINNQPSKKVSKDIRDTKPNPVEADQTIEEKDKQKKNRRGLFKRLFVAKTDLDTEKDEEVTRETEPAKLENITEQPSYEYFQYEKFILKSKRYGFSLVGDLKDRCSELIGLEDQLLAVTNSEIHSIDANKNVSTIFFGSHIFDVVQSKVDENKIYVIDKKGLFIGNRKGSNWNFSLKTESDNSFNITSIAEISENIFLISLNNELVKVNLDTGEIEEIPLINPYSESVLIKQVEEKIYILVGASLFRFVDAENNLSKIKFHDSASVALAFLKQPNVLCIKTTGNKYQYFGEASISEKVLSALKIFDDIKDIHIDVNNNIWVINNSGEIYKINTSEFQNYNSPCNVFITKIETTNGTPLSGDQFELKYVDNSLTFSFVSPSGLKLNSNQYQYIIEGLMEDWSDWSNNNTITIPYFPHGSYKLKYRAKNILDVISETQSVDFKVLPPFWKTIYFYALLILTLILSIYYWQKYRLRKLVKEKEILQQKVNERTKELQVKNDSITDSINYAGKIQKALLPPTGKLESILDDYFVFYQPKDIISGDFYLVAERRRYTVIIAADSTGHGVPGAFMSMLGMAYINEILAAADFSVTAAEILNLLREKIITLLHQHNEDSRDGMDMVVLLFDKHNNILQYAGAHNPLYRLIPKKHTIDEDDKDLLQNENEHYYLIQYKANRFQVGNSKKAHIEFTNHVIDYEAEEKFYIFSDGFVDQFGGDEERKFMYGRFRKLLLENAHKPMMEQKKILEKTLIEWKGDLPQTDDILIFGMKP